MATWDGSYQGPDDSNYQYYPYDFCVRPMEPNPWAYYPPSETHQNRQGGYAPTPMNYPIPNQNVYGSSVSTSYNSSMAPQDHGNYAPSQFENHQTYPSDNNHVYNNETQYFHNSNRRDNRDYYPKTDSSQKKSSEPSSSGQGEKKAHHRNAKPRTYGSSRLNCENFDSSIYESLINEGNANASTSGNGNEDRRQEEGQRTGEDDEGYDPRSSYRSNERHLNDKFRGGKGRFGNWNKEKQFNRTGNKSTGRKFAPREQEKEFSNWRNKDKTGPNVNSKNTTFKKGYNSGGNYKKVEMDDDASQRERLTEQLNKGVLECLVCCDHIKQADSIWSCENCYHVLHVKCIKKWAISSKDDSGAWRCPACRNQFKTTHLDYHCFCSKLKNPEWNRRDNAHSCGEVCGRNRSNLNCVHKCTLLCHPGSCPECSAIVTKHCNCGKMSQTVKCSTGTPLLCQNVCEKLLNCRKHHCQNKCHEGDCENCTEKIQQSCYCEKNKREVACEENTPTKYECGEICDKFLDCENHRCTEPCHPDSCAPCLLKPEIVTHCCCQQTPIENPRTSCTDPIPTCGKICSKPLKCGQPSAPHKCQSQCHEGDCPECKLTTMVRCRCGNMDKEIPCKELTTKADDARCEKKCTKKRSCRKHKCNQLCCIDIEHICPLICYKTLSCGRHKCEQTCHMSRCQPCWRSSFDELYCECGAAVLYPPIACGTRRPACSQPCSRSHPCDHEVFHNCHSESTCPPCTVLTQKWCHGGHELRRNVPCHVKELSCGLQCHKDLSCGRHKCINNCHPGPCESPGQVCVQPCTVPRESCGHICAAPCHEGKCPDTPCKETVKVTCQCGHRTSTRQCAENTKEYHRIASGILASKMKDMQLGHSVNLDEVFGQKANKANQLKTLECNDECKTVERNRRLALGLQIVNPDLTGKLTPRYSDFMKQWAKKDPGFCQMVHDRLSELVQLAKTSKQKSRSYSFESMNKDKRSFVHESCEHFGCQSQAYDQEPKRNVVATAVKDKCWLPSYSLLEVIQRENGLRKVPGPMLESTKMKSKRNTEMLLLNGRMNQKPTPVQTPTKSPEPEIDYFEFTGF